MNEEFLILNIREYLRQGEGGEDLLRQVLSTFSCKKNVDVERFLLNQSIDFTKKNQSVTYLVLSAESGLLVGYFTITVKSISVNGEGFSNTVKRKIARVSEQDPVNGTYSLAAYLVAQLGKNFSNGINDMITGDQLLGLAIQKIKELQYMVGGMVVFLETENEAKSVCASDILLGLCAARVIYPSSITNCCHCHAGNRRMVGIFTWYCHA